MPFTVTVKEGVFGSVNPRQVTLPSPGDPGAPLNAGTVDQVFDAFSTSKTQFRIVVNDQEAEIGTLLANNDVVGCWSFEGRNPDPTKLYQAPKPVEQIEQKVSIADLKRQLEELRQQEQQRTDRLANLNRQREAEQAATRETEAEKARLEEQILSMGGAAIEEFNRARNALVELGLYSTGAVQSFRTRDLLNRKAYQSEQFAYSRADLRQFVKDDFDIDLPEMMSREQIIEVYLKVRALACPSLLKF